MQHSKWVSATVQGWHIPTCMSDNKANYVATPPPFHMEVPPANKMLENIGKHFANVKKLYFALVGQLAHESVLLGHLHHCTASSSCMYFEAAVEELVEH